MKKNEIKITEEDIKAGVDQAIAEVVEDNDLQDFYKNNQELPYVIKFEMERMKYCDIKDYSSKIKEIKEDYLRYANRTIELNEIKEKILNEEISLLDLDNLMREYNFGSAFDKNYEVELIETESVFYFKYDEVDEGIMVGFEWIDDDKELSINSIIKIKNIEEL